MAKNYERLAEELLEKVGGSSNVASVYHCATRLRFDLKDESIPNDDEVKGIRGVLGISKAGGQYQIIIGPDVAKLYAVVCKIGNFQMNQAVDENLDSPKGKFSIKKGIANFFGYVSGTVTELIPILVAATMVKTIQVIIGPSLLNLISAESDTYRLFDLVYNAFFYFMPIYIGYSASKKLKTNIPLGLLLGGIMLVPNLTAIVEAGEAFSIYGIPMKLVSYSGTMFPMLLTIYCLKYVNDFAEKHISDMFAMSFRPLIVLLVMIPLELCVLGPIGGYIGDGLAALIKACEKVPFITGAIGGLWLFIVATGMHLPLVQAINIPEQMTYGYQKVLSPAIKMSNICMHGMVYAAILKTKNKGNKATYASYLLSGAAEPGLYGVVFKNPRCIPGLAIGGAVTGIIVTCLGAIVYPSQGIPLIGNWLGFIAGGTTNILKGFICAAAALAFGFLWAWFYGLDGDEFKKIETKE
ncbi:MAG: PTS transporter subunit EIIC [Traorella sp.]